MCGRGGSSGHDAGGAFRNGAGSGFDEPGPIAEAPDAAGCRDQYYGQSGGRGGVFSGLFDGCCAGDCLCDQYGCDAGLFDDGQCFDRNSAGSFIGSMLWRGWNDFEFDSDRVPVSGWDDGSFWYWRRCDDRYDAGESCSAARRDDIDSGQDGGGDQRAFLMA